MKGLKIIYEHEWGDEDILSAFIQIRKCSEEDTFIILFKQESFDTFLNLTTVYEILAKKQIFDIVNDLSVYTLWMKIKVKCNPKPEEMFKFI